MNRRDARKLISAWFDLPAKKKDREWGKVLPYINKYRDIYDECRIRKYGKQNDLLHR